MTWRVFRYEVVDERPGFVVVRVDGDKAQAAFSRENGGHRWQRVPPNEKKGRRHTSTVTVAVLPVLEQAAASFPETEIVWWATRGTGKGGQAKNKTSNAVHMKHEPTGITVRVETSRSQWENRKLAKALLFSKLSEWALGHAESVLAKDRRAKVGSGQRGDKIRTIRMQDHQVIDHQSGKRIPVARYLKGHVGELV